MSTFIYYFYICVCTVILHTFIKLLVSLTTDIGIIPTGKTVKNTNFTICIQQCFDLISSNLMESKGYSSLFDLVNNHLSQTSINDVTMNGIENTTEFHNGSISESVLFSPKRRLLKLPSLNDSDSSIRGVLTEQVANMLKAKEKAKQEHKLANDMTKIKLDCNNDYVIDLLQSLQTPYKRESFSEESLSTSSAFESLCKMNFAAFEETAQKQTDNEQLLPCVNNMCYITRENVWKSKCSRFGKVLTSRLRPVAAPYLCDRIKTDIKSFDFKTKSPCDNIKDNLRKPCNGFNRF